MLTNDTLDVHQVDFRAEGLSARRMHPQHAALQMRAKANARRGKAAHDFGRIFVKADVKRAFLTQTRSFSKGARQDGFTRACGTGDQHASSMPLDTRACEATGATVV